MNFDWKKAVANVAPVLGTAMGGGFGGIAAKVLTDALGLSAGASEKEIEKLFQTDPEAILKAKNAEYIFLQKMKELGIKEDELAYKDVDSARNREISLKDSTPKELAGLITFGFFGLLASLLFVAIPEKSEAILYVMVGALGSSWQSIVNYFFGSSAGSSKKNDIIERLRATK